MIPKDDPRFHMPMFPRAKTSYGGDNTPRFESKVVVINAFTGLTSVEEQITPLYKEGWALVAAVQNMLFFERPVKKITEHVEHYS